MKRSLELAFTIAVLLGILAMILVGPLLDAAVGPDREWMIPYGYLKLGAFVVVSLLCWLLGLGKPRT